MSAFNRWHIGKDGKPARCTASKRACPFASHFDTADHAYNRGQESMYYSDDPGDSINIEYSIAVKSSGIENVPEERSAFNLKKASIYAAKRFRETGKRVRFPGGKIDIDFGGGQRLVLYRQTFSIQGRGFGTRWKFIDFDSPDDWNDYNVNCVPGSGSYPVIQERLTRKFARAREARIEALGEARVQGHNEDADPEYDRNLKQAYENALQVIDQIETMANGAEYAQRSYGIDLFTKDDPSKLELNLDLSRSTVQVYDVVDSLKVHSAEDVHLKKVEVNISEKLSGTGNSWMVSRIPEGNWYFSTKINGDSTSREIDPRDPATVDEISTAVQRLYTKSGESPTEGGYQSSFVRQALTEVAPAINSYEHTMEARFAERRAAAETHVESEPPKKAMKNRLFKMFG